MQPIDSLTEQRLIKASEEVITLVNQGETPTGALVKIARQQKLNPEQTRRVGESYNTSRAMHHFKTASGLDRHRNFPLADLDQAVDSIFSPENVKSASITETRPRINYLAQEHERTPTPLVKRASAPKTNPALQKALVKQARDETESARMEVKRASYELEREIHQAQDAIRNSNTPFHELEMGIHSRYEKVGKSLSDMLWRVSRCEKLGHRRATAQELDASRYTLLDLAGPSHATVERLVKKSLEFHDKVNKYAQARTKLEQHEPMGKEAARVAVPFGGSRTEESSAAKYFKKQSFGGLTGKVLKEIGGIGDRFNPKGQYNEALLDATQSLQDPDLREDIRQINIMTMLNDLLTDDPVISEYDPEEVIEYFNELAQVAPEAVDKPAIMRDMLRRSLQQGSIPAFEAGQAAGLSNDLARQQQSGQQERDLTTRVLEENRLRDETMPTASNDSWLQDAIKGGPKPGNVAAQRLAIEKSRFGFDKEKEETRKGESDRDARLREAVARAQRRESERDYEFAREKEDTRKGESERDFDFNVAKEDVRQDEVAAQMQLQEARDDFQRRHTIRRDRFDRNMAQRQYELAVQKGELDRAQSILSAMDKEDEIRRNANPNRKDPFSPFGLHTMDSVVKTLKKPFGAP